MPDKKNIKKSIALLSEICSLMMSSGANTKRVIGSVNRFASALNFESHALISHKSITMTLTDKLTEENYTRVSQIPKYKINFSVVAVISRLSWTAEAKHWDYDKIKSRIETVKNEKRYPFWAELLTVSLAGAGFAKLFGGDYLNMFVAFIATLVGMLVSKTAARLNVNSYARTYLSAVFASLVSSLGILWNIGHEPQVALATSVLFLVPGVPLINSFIDLFNNHILNGIVRFVSGFITVLAIGLGIITVMVMFNINNFM
ncbi:MAG: hypothetical protein DRI94_06545 [Bacteroidetes bacterium]|nr:MAG: hypothetical protein DRI94_06545 [Bacteroidota bacterium]